MANHATVPLRRGLPFRSITHWKAKWLAKMNCGNEVESKIDQEALRRSNGDMALWYHHRALLDGEHRIYHRGKAHWNSYQRNQRLSQYRDCEQSVIHGWRKFVKNIWGIPPEKQRDFYTVNCAIVFDSLRRHPDQANDLLKERAEVFHAAIEKCDVDFFRHVGRLLSERGISPYLKTFTYPHAMLSRWLTDCLWLMPAKLVSSLLSTGLDLPENIRTFLGAKSRYALNSHKPTLISHFEKAGTSASCVLTKEGRLLLNPRK